MRTLLDGFADCPNDAVEALGGPKAFFAIAFAEAKIAGQDKEFMAGFEGVFPGKRKGRKAKIGQHTAGVVEERAEMPDGQSHETTQGQLF